VTTVAAAPAARCAYLAFRRRGVALLDDARDAAIGADDAPVAVRPLHICGDDGCRGACRAVRLEQPRQSGRGQQRHVAREQHQRSRPACEQRLRLLQRVRGAALRLLQRELKAGNVAKPVANGVRLVTDDERGGGGADGGRRPQDVSHHRAPGYRMEDFWQPRFHTRALSGSQNDDVSLRIGHSPDFLARSMMA
jgi:hypothetical protein